MYLALLTLVQAGDEVLIPNPGFVAYPTITRMAGGQSTFYRLPAASEFSFDLDDFKRQLSSKTKVVVCTSPSNPTGRTLTNEELRSMARAVEESGTDAFIISDEIYRDLYYTGERPGSISEFYPRTVVISGLSKSTVHDRLAPGVDSRRRDRNSRRAFAAWLRDDLRVNNFAEGRAGRLE